MATPIGNLADISHRALDTLAAVDRILAEDTRRTRKLLAHHGVRARLEAYHEHNEAARTPAVIDRLLQGRRMALVTDAGTPGISDPGYRLVRAAIEAGVPVVPIPGPSAPVTALVASGLPTNRFTFAGYPPRKRGERRRFLAELGAGAGTLILLESPRRLRATLRDAAEVLGADRPAAIARELTKAHEEIRRGTLARLLDTLPEAPLKGEITLCVGQRPGRRGGATSTAPGAEQLRERYRRLLDSGTPRNEALRALARETGMRRRDVYETVLLSSPEPIPSDGDDTR